MLIMSANKILTVLLGVLFVAYPFFVYFGQNHFRPRIIGIAIFVLIILRVAVLSWGNYKKLLQFLPMLAAVSLGSLASIIFDSERFLLLTPVFVSVSLLFSFGITLIKKPSMIERFARLRHNRLPESAIKYCYNVTIIWCLFFVFNALMSFISAIYLTNEYWMLYNGLISYLLIGLLYFAEYLVRIKKMHGEETNDK